MPGHPGGAPLRPATPPQRPLRDVLALLPDASVTGAADGASTVLSGCTHDSRAVQPGDLYAALPGARAHGADFAAAATAAGAAAGAWPRTTRR